VKRRKLLDSFAMLAYLNRESGFQKVLDLMTEAQKTGDVVFVNEVNIGEAYYIISRGRSAGDADYFLDTILPLLPLTPIPASFNLVIEAARIKSRHPLSYADAFAVATALQENAAIVTGDPEFRLVESIVAVEWI